MSVTERKFEYEPAAAAPPADVRLDGVTKRFDAVVAVDDVSVDVPHGSFSYVVVTVKARLVGFDRQLEEAALDLGASESTTFRKVTLPLIAPGILAGALLAFALSVDDFVITYSNSGSEVTFPLFVWGAARVGAPPQVNVIGTAIFVVALGLMLVNVILQTRRTKGSA